MQKRQTKTILLALIVSTTIFYSETCSASLLSKTTSYAKGAICGLAPLAGRRMMRWIAKGQDTETQKSLFQGYKHSSITAITTSSLVTAATAGLAALLFRMREIHKKQLDYILNHVPKRMCADGIERPDISNTTPDFVIMPLEGIYKCNRAAKFALAGAIVSGLYATQKSIEYARVSKDFAQTFAQQEQPSKK